ncbi:conserved protein, unknown function, partial [Hepatocystis sp. ex Piliocolobus tephrosceles]
KQINIYNLFLINKSLNNSTILNDNIVDISQIKDEDNIFLGINEINKKNECKHIYKIKYNKMVNFLNINNLFNHNNVDTIDNNIYTTSPVVVGHSAKKRNSINKIIPNPFFLFNNGGSGGGGATAAGATAAGARINTHNIIMNDKNNNDNNNNISINNCDDYNKNEKTEAGQVEKTEQTEQTEKTICIIIFIIMNNDYKIKEPIYHIYNKSILPITDTTPYKKIYKENITYQNETPIYKMMLEDSPNGSGGGGATAAGATAAGARINTHNII